MYSLRILPQPLFPLVPIFVYCNGPIVMGGTKSFKQKLLRDN